MRKGALLPMSKIKYYQYYLNIIYVIFIIIKRITL